MKVTVFYLQDGLARRKTFKGKRVVVHIHDDWHTPYKRGYVRVDKTEHMFSSVVRMSRKR